MSEFQLSQIMFDSRVMSFMSVFTLLYAQDISYPLPMFLEKYIDNDFARVLFMFTLSFYVTRNVKDAMVVTSLLVAITIMPKYAMGDMSESFGPHLPSELESNPCDVTLKFPKEYNIPTYCNTFQSGEEHKYNPGDYMYNIKNDEDDDMQQNQWDGISQQQSSQQEVQQQSEQQVQQRKQQQQMPQQTVEEQEMQEQMQAPMDASGTDAGDNLEGYDSMNLYEDNF